MHALISRQLAADFCCTEADVLVAQHHFTVFQPPPDRRQYMEIRPCLLKIAVVRGKLLFTGREDIIARCEGITCGPKATSCPDQLALALKEALANI